MTHAAVTTRSNTRFSSGVSICTETSIFPHEYLTRFVWEMEVSVQIETPDEKRVLLRVRDCGVGIPADDLKRIFKRFYRVRRLSQSKVKGTGLGLFIVRSIAKSHGGKVSAESAGEGQGTTVTLELPRSAA